MSDDKFADNISAVKTFYEEILFEQRRTNKLLEKLIDLQTNGLADAMARNESKKKQLLSLIGKSNPAMAEMISKIG